MIFRPIVLALMMSLVGSNLWGQVTSKEEIQFVPRGQRAFVDETKPEGFKGVIKRVNEHQADIRLIDLYEFPSEKSTAMTKSLCDKVLVKIFGPASASGLTLSSLKMQQTPMGSVCEVQLDDTLDPHARIPERRILIGMLKFKPQALVFKLSQKSDAATRESILKFWKGLR